MVSKTKVVMKQVGLRFSETLRRRVTKAARERGVTMNAEIVMRVEESFASNERWGGAGVAPILEVVGAAMKSTGEMAGFLETHKPMKDGDWLANAFAFDQALKAAVAVLEAHRPPGDIVMPKWETTEVVGGDPEEAQTIASRFETELGAMIAAKTMADLKQGGDDA